MADGRFQAVLSVGMAAAVMDVTPVILATDRKPASAFLLLSLPQLCGNKSDSRGGSGHRTRQVT